MYAPEPGKKESSLRLLAHRREIQQRSCGSTRDEVLAVLNIGTINTTTRAQAKNEDPHPSRNAAEGGESQLTCQRQTQNLLLGPWQTPTPLSLKTPAGAPGSSSADSKSHL